MRFLAIKIGGQEIAPPGGIPEGGFDTVQTVIRNVLIILFIVAIVMTLIYLIWGGIDWITSGGNKEGLEKARKKITFAIIGLVVTLLAFLIVNVVGGFFEIRLFGILPLDKANIMLLS